MRPRRSSCIYCTVRAWQLQARVLTTSPAVCYRSHKLLLADKEEEERKEQELEEKIRKMRKERQRTRRTDRPPNQPKRKKQRIEMENNLAIDTLIKEMRRGEKRRENQQTITHCVEQARKRLKIDSERAEHHPSTTTDEQDLVRAEPQSRAGSEGEKGQAEQRQVLNVNTALIQDDHHRSSSSRRLK